jgi:hypothetical protein
MIADLADEPQANLRRLGGDPTGREHGAEPVARLGVVQDNLAEVGLPLRERVRDISPWCQAPYVACFTANTLRLPTVSCRLHSRSALAVSSQYERLSPPPTQAWVAAPVAGAQ